jgi:16S rRNA processing protein RimM
MLLIVGQIGKPHGIRGELLVTVRTDEPEARFVAGSVFTTQVPRDRRVGTGPARGGPIGPPTANAVAATDGTSPPNTAAANTAAANTAVPNASAPNTAAANTPGVRFQVPEKLTLESLRWHQGRIIAVFEGIDDRNVAEMLRGVMLCVDSEQIAPPDDPDEFHDHQLVGLRVESVDGESLGEVLRIDHAQASDLIVVRRPDGGTALIPFVRQIVPTVDIPGGRVIVDPPGGLFDL